MATKTIDSKPNQFLVTFETEEDADSFLEYMNEAEMEGEFDGPFQVERTQ